VNQNGIALFRWMYFFCAWPVLWVMVNYANNKIFAFVEWLFYRDAITYLDRCAAWGRLLSSDSPSALTQRKSGQVRGLVTTNMCQASAASGCICTLTPSTMALCSTHRSSVHTLLAV
jgi:hypothetical protein